MFTHGGMNSVSECCAYKIPMVVVPFYGDQKSNAEWLCARRWATKIETGEVKLEAKWNITADKVMTSFLGALELQLPEPASTAEEWQEWESFLNEI